MLAAVSYYVTNFDKRKSLVLPLNSKESVVIKENQIMCQSPQVETDIQTIYMNYIVLSNDIQSLQNTSLTLVDQLKIQDEVRCYVF